MHIMEKMDDIKILGLKIVLAKLEVLISDVAAVKPNDSDFTGINIINGDACATSGKYSTS